MENLKEFSRRNANDEKGVWTNKKHNIYLNSLEASFVDQLNHSMGMLLWRSEQNSSKKLDENTDQFTVLRDGSWHKINFENKKPLLKTISNSHSVLESQLTRHFRRAKTVVPKDEISRGKRSFRHDIIDSLAEVSDQNFVDGDQNERSSDLKKPKRLKKASEYISSHDQVVTLGKSQVTELSNVDVATPESEEQSCQKWSTENSDRYALQEHGLKSFFSES